MEGDVAVFSVHLGQQFASQLYEIHVRLLPREESYEVGVGTETNPIVSLIEDGSVPLQQSPGDGHCPR